MKYYRPMRLSQIKVALESELRVPEGWQFYDPDNLLRSTWPDADDEPGLYSADKWGRIEWNPPHFVEVLQSAAGARITRLVAGDTDPNASAKPSWTEVSAIWDRYRNSLDRIKRRAVRELKAEGQRRITAAYFDGGTGRTLEDEFKLRLRNGQTAAQDTERDRLRGKYAGIKGRIEGATTTKAVAAIDVTADGLWAETNGGGQ